VQRAGAVIEGPVAKDKVTVDGGQQGGRVTEHKRLFLLRGLRVRGEFSEVLRLKY